jgi:pimeloyl-ACP methyl ester carboxylesterase
MPSHTLRINGIDLHYLAEGSGEPLLLLHGATGSHADWQHLGADEFARNYAVIRPDARGHGRSTNPSGGITHRQCAQDAIALLDHLAISRCRAIGMSMGGNILLHMATMHPGRIEAMILVSATMYFPPQARAIMRQVPLPADQPAHEWEAMRKRHHLGDEQIPALWAWCRRMADSHDDLNFTPEALAAITARTLVIYGDRDPLYPVEMAVEMYRAIPKSELWVVPGGGHGPVFGDPAPSFIRTALRFFSAPGR